ncbi:hypothetical protein ACTMTF_00865 [Nonomuraea sp. ZG12]
MTRVTLCGSSALAAGRRHRAAELAGRDGELGRVGVDAPLVAGRPSGA